MRYDLMKKNKTGKYLKYAIGEIVLVVIGILIALSINNWNEGRKNDQKESLLIKNIIEDLNLDSVHINQSLNELEDQLNIVDELIGKALGSKKILNSNLTGLVRYSSDFRPISQRNHAESVSNLENESTRKILQSYFLMEDQVLDMFKEYEGIIHNYIRPYLRDVGMHNLESLYEEQPDETNVVLLQPKILEEQLGNIKFQQLLFERRIKTDVFKSLLNELKSDNQELIKILSSNNK
jgi:energy-converting hydrogenase A subunit M